MSDHAFKSTILILSLTKIEFVQAARLGGLTKSFETQHSDDLETYLEVTRFFAEKGITKAIKETHERHFPVRYPEDIDPRFWSEKSTIQSFSGQFGHIWRGQI